MNATDEQQTAEDQGLRLPRSHMEFIQRAAFETARAHKVWSKSTKSVVWCNLALVVSILVLIWSIISPGFPEFGAPVVLAVVLGCMIYRWSLKKLIEQGGHEMQRVQLELSEIGVAMSYEGDLAFAIPQNGEISTLKLDPMLYESYD